MDPIDDDAGSDALGRQAGSSGVVAMLRKQISDGLYPAGTRLAEIPVADALGVSRTPVRLAFRTLAQEGLLQRSTGKRGFVVRRFSAEDVQCAVEVRGVLEGLAARRLAERGLPPDTHRVLLDCLAEGEQVLKRGRLVAADIDRWSRLNSRFHDTIVGAATAGASRVIADAIARNDHLPFASAGSITVQKDALDREYQKLKMAQMQHRLVVEALEAGESARVEMLMREHAYIGVRYARLFGLDGLAVPGEVAAPPRRAAARRGAEG